MRPRHHSHHRSACSDIVLQENDELRATLAVAEATAAAATAELLQTRSGLTRLQSSRAMKTHRLVESMSAASCHTPPLRSLNAAPPPQPPPYLLKPRT